MTPFTVRNWKNTLIKVYEKAQLDPTYRALCIANPMAAVAEVSDIELPPDFRFAFFVDPKTMLYTFLLPPARAADASNGDVADQLISWSVNCTYPTGD